MSSGPVPQASSSGSSNDVVEDLLKQRIKALETELQADAISYCGPITFTIDDLIRDAVEKLTPKRDRIAMVLETEGGYIEVAERIARVLRHHYHFVEFIVPNYAMSAGTVLVMSGDVIRMDYYSILGPIDPQVQRAGSRAWVPTHS
jgi:ClpP class serine protease